MYKLHTNRPAWVRIYPSIADRILDSGRAYGAAVPAGVKVLTEISHTSADQTTVFLPALVGFNSETPASNNIPVAIGNLGDAEVSITVTLTVLQLEE